jgi:transposase-like protein
MSPVAQCPFCESHGVVVVERLSSLTEYRCPACGKHWVDSTQTTTDDNDARIRIPFRRRSDLMASLY